MQNQAKWDQDYLALAQWWADRKSKDPSTKVGAVVVDTYNSIVGVGYNGFPKGVHDTPERYADREQKYPRVVHSEPNAIITAGHQCRGATLYVSPLYPCNECAKLIIQAGIIRVVVVSGCTPADSDRWGAAQKMAAEMFQEAGVQVDYV